mmetsp:Transcript_38516/g.63518  ORF Transcript_38516/g.63518 Transcript_38516/m.63518 type:complete len:229 (+) Transcript_38516:243-929(+)
MAALLAHFALDLELDLIAQQTNVPFIPGAALVNEPGTHIFMWLADQEMQRMIPDYRLLTQDIHCGRGIFGFIQDLLDSFRTDLQPFGHGGTIEAAAEALDPALHLGLFRHVLVRGPHGDRGPLGLAFQRDAQHHPVLRIVQRHQPFPQTDPQQRRGRATLRPAAAAAAEAARGALVAARIAEARTAPHHVEDRALPTQMAGAGVLGGLQAFMAPVVAVQEKGLSNEQV